MTITQDNPIEELKYSIEELDNKVSSIESDVSSIEVTLNVINDSIGDIDNFSELKQLLMEQTLIQNGWRELSYGKWFPPNENSYSHEGEEIDVAYSSLKEGFNFTSENAALKKVKKHISNTN